MKKKLFAVFSILILLHIMVSCGMSKSDIENTVRRSFQSQMDTDATYKEYGMKVQSVSLIKVDSRNYDGFVTVELEGDRYNVPITVRTDGTQVMWETKPLAFAFLIQYNLRNLRW